MYEDQLKLKKTKEVEQEFKKKNGEDVRLSENKWAISVKQLGEKFGLLEIGLKISVK